MHSSSPKRQGTGSSVEASPRKLRKGKFGSINVKVSDLSSSISDRTMALQEMKYEGNKRNALPRHENIGFDKPAKQDFREESADWILGVENYFLQGKPPQYNRSRDKPSKGRVVPHQEDSDSCENVGDIEEVKDEVRKNFSCCDPIALRDYMKNPKFATQNKDRISRIKQHFNWWTFCLAGGFNLLLYGVGSKRNLVNEFRKDQLDKFCTLTIDGFKEDINTKIILTRIVEFLQLKNCEQKQGSLIDWGRQIAAAIEQKSHQLIILLHNIDGPNLRDPFDQSVLAALVENPAILMVATVDHINATLLHSNRHLESFKWIYFRADTFEFPLHEVLAGHSSLLGLDSKNNNSAHSLSSLDVLWKSLATNSRSIFRLFYSIFYNNGEPVSFWDLFITAKDEFLVSSDTALRQQLTEFSDHRILRWIRCNDGNERLTGLLDRSLVEQFLAEKGYDLNYT